jgi:hypothetical protein
MATADTLRDTRIPLMHGSGAIPAVGFGTLIPDLAVTKEATRTALQAGFRHLDCAERYRNESAVGDAMQALFKLGTIRRDDVFVTTKIWNTNHRPERVKPAFDASCRRLQVDYIDCYLIHTPFAFLPGDEQDPRDQNGRVIYDPGVTLVDTWRALERLVDGGHCGRSAYPMSPWKNSRKSPRPHGSSLRWCKSNPIRTFRNGTCSRFAGSMGSCCWHSRRWDTACLPKCWTTLSSQVSRGA